MRPTDQLGPRYSPEPEPDVIGKCGECSGDMWAIEVATCECGTALHTGCLIECEQCSRRGCSKCIPYDEELCVDLCDTTGPDKVKVSECKDNWLNQ